MFAASLQEAVTRPVFWLVIAVIGTACWGGRFIVQWVASERAGKSVIPVPFWYLSIGGAVLTLSYAIWLGDPFFIIQQSGGCFIYFRNIALIRRERQRAST